MYGKWRPQAFMIEDAASGTALLSDMRKTTPIPFVGVKVKGSKETRAEAITPLFEAGRCVMPTRELLPIVDDFIDEHVKFASGRHDDMVDASGHALTRIRELRRYDQMESPTAQVMRIRGF